MFISKAALKQFRNIDTLNIELSRSVNIMYGANAQGKTNFLESIYLCSTGRSHRTNYDRELIMFGQAESHVQLFVNGESHSERLLTDRIDVHLKKDSNKGIAVNGTPVRKLGDLLGVLLTVIFSPEDLQLVKSGPSERRRFLDMEICQISAVYCYDLQQYHKVLKQRNNLLKILQKDKSQIDSIFMWDEQLAHFGAKLIDSRKEFVKKISEISRKIHYKITDNKEKLEIIYKPSVEKDEFLNKLKRSLERDIYTGSTSFGIHKDEIIFLINGVDARIFGSQGQQRTTSLSLKLAEIDIIKEEKNEKPVLLLDDVLSELDKSRQTYLLDSISGIQTIITCTGVEDILSGLSDNSFTKIYNVKNGRFSLK